LEPLNLPKSSAPSPPLRSRRRLDAGGALSDARCDWIAIKTLSAAGPDPQRESLPVIEDNPLLGAPAPGFELEATTGDIVRLSSHRGRNVVLFFVREFT
jgi:hypothetical protein